MSLDKQFHGDLEATGKGQMLTAGTLHGRSGSFVLHHTGIMTRGQSQLTIAVVPDSGTDELVGISGSLSIEIADRKHFYTFDYTLPENC